MSPTGTSASAGPLQETLVDGLQRIGCAAWVVVVTERPSCTYYFGPFLCRPAAARWQPGYIEDLEAEGARIVSVTIARCRPQQLTQLAEPAQA